MIITCQSCNKKFDIDQNLIPEKGRLLQCSSCNHKWFFKNELAIKTIESPTNENFQIFDVKKPQINNPIDDDNGATINTKKTSHSKEIIKKIKIQKKNNFLNLIIIYIISFVAIIIILDTFKSPLSKIVPNLEFLLYNLYETINDIGLFIKDLIQPYD
jgi:predicted Zn finger-like uncharacterized protein